MEPKVIKRFRDKETRKVYEVGQAYEGTEERVEELVSLGYVTTTEEELKIKHTGGGWYELSNGEKVQGKEEAIAAEKELQAAE